MEFLDLRKNQGKEELRTRDLFLALWTSDLFMERVKEDGEWHLFSPDAAPKLHETYGEEFKKWYQKYVDRGAYVKVVKARDIWYKVLESQIETGTPYMLYKDAANEKSNQKNLGIIKSSNLCTEILEYTSPDEVAVCNLGSIALPKFIDIPNGKIMSKDKSKRTFNHDKLYKIAYQLTLNLDQVIDRNYYPVPEAKNSNMKHRPIGIGVQGLADTFAMLDFPFDSEEAKKLNKEIFETIYYASMTASKDIAKDKGTYESYEGSPLSEGKFQFHLWNVSEDELSGRWDWKKLGKQVKKYGARNSLLLAPMPTASTAQILGNNECFEPFTSNLYKRNTLSGEYVIINKHLVDDLVNMDLWDDKMRLRLFSDKGSVLNNELIPEKTREVYKTVWEMSQKNIIDMAADRGLFICQSQSMNLFIQNVNMNKLTSAHFYAWEKGLKTGMYYLRTKSAVDASSRLGIDNEKEKTSLNKGKVTINENPQQISKKSVEMPSLPKDELSKAEQEAYEELCSLDNPDACEACGS
jgi:ribonucleoside-diphosphate reductase alpha chain